MKRTDFLQPSCSVKIIVTSSTQPKYSVQLDLSHGLPPPVNTFNFLFKFSVFLVSQRHGERGLVVPTVRQPPRPYGGVMQTGTQFVTPADSTINCTM